MEPQMTTQPTTAIVEVEHFRMDFGSNRVIDDLSFEVQRGETFGFLGSNGSGKTTTIRALLGIYPPTAGRLVIDGIPFHPETARTIGYLPEERGLYKKEPVIDVMTYFGVLKGMERSAAHDWSLSFLERVELGGMAKVRLDKLSGGQQQKVQLGVTIMNQPELLILDEPTKGFDPVNRRLLLDLIDERRQDGAAVVMVTHQMDEVEHSCDRILLLKDGRSRAYGTVREVQQEFGGMRVKIEYSGTLTESAEYRILSNDGHQAVLEPDIDAAALLELLSSRGARISQFTPGWRSLDEIFIEVYGAPEGEVA